VCSTSTPLGYWTAALIHTNLRERRCHGAMQQHTPRAVAVAKIKALAAGAAQARGRRG
jgi:hypothetical protein